MRLKKIIFWFLLVGAALPYLFVGLAVLKWGDMLFIHEPDDLFGAFFYSVQYAYSGLSFILIPLFIAVQVVSMIRNKIRLFSFELISILLLGAEFILFISIRSNFLLWYVD